MTIQYAYLETGNLNREDVVIDTSPPGDPSNTVVVQFDDSDSPQTVINTLNKVEAKFMWDWAQIYTGAPDSFWSFELPADDISSLDDVAVLPITSPSGANTVRLQVDQEDAVQPIIGTVMKILVAMYPTMGGIFQYIMDENGLVLVDGLPIFVA